MQIIDSVRATEFHLSSSLHNSGLMVKSFEHCSPKSAGFASRSLSHGRIQFSNTYSEWIKERRSWLDLIKFSTNLQQDFEFEHFINDAFNSNSIGIWYGDVLDEQLFAMLMLALLFKLELKPEVKMFQCFNGSVEGNGMQSLNPCTLLQVARVSFPKDEDFEKAHNMWSLISSSEQFRLSDHYDLSPLFLPQALKTIHNRFPSVRNGLDLWEDWIIQHLVRGPARLSELIVECVCTAQVNSYDRVSPQELIWRISALSDHDTGIPLIDFCDRKSNLNSIICLTSDGLGVALGKRHYFELFSASKWVFGLEISKLNPWVSDGMNVRKL